MMRKPLLAGNWKMNGDRASLSALARGIVRSLHSSPPRQCELLVLPPFVYLPEVSGELQGSVVGVGAQDLDVRHGGAVTGAVSAAMLKDIGCSHVLVGHSERRSLFGETDDLVARKFKRALDAGLTPILCVGESLDERKAGLELAVVGRQLDAVSQLVGADGLAGGLVAYEPVWAIGTGESATPEQAESVHGGLRRYLDALDPQLARQTKILYGGSVTPENAASLLGQDNIDGALIGGASLKVESFMGVVHRAEGTL